MRRFPRAPRVSRCLATRGAETVVLYGARDRTPYRESGGVQVARDVARALREGGARPVVVEFDPQTVGTLAARNRSGRIFNLVYGYAGPKGERLEQFETTALLEAVGLHPIGSPADVQRRVQDKLTCSRLLNALGYRVPAPISRASRARGVRAVRKPRFGAAHRDVSLLHAEDLPHDDDDGWLVQEYVAGPEYTLGIVELHGEPFAFPPLRIDFHDPAPSVMTGPQAWETVPEPEDRYGLAAVAARVFRDLGMRGYARIDVRVDRGEPVVLDVNSLPNLHRTRSYLPLAAQAAGWRYDDLVRAIARS